MWNLWLAIWILKTAPAILFIYERMIYAIILNGIWMLFWTRLIFPHIRHKWKIHRVPAALMDLIISQPLKDVAKYLKKTTTTLFSFFFSFHNFNRFSLNFWTVNIWCRFFNVSQSRHLKWKWNINPVLATNFCCNSKEIERSAQFAGPALFFSEHIGVFARHNH